MGRPLELDLFSLILIAAMVAVLISFVCTMFRIVRSRIRVSRFFARHRPTVGILDQYEKIDADTDVTMYPFLLRNQCISYRALHIRPTSILYGWNADAAIRAFMPPTEFRPRTMSKSKPEHPFK